MWRYHIGVLRKLFTAYKLEAESCGYVVLHFIYAVFRIITQSLKRLFTAFYMKGPKKRLLLRNMVYLKRVLFVQFQWLGAHFTRRTYEVKQGFRFVEGIGYIDTVIKFGFFFFRKKALFTSYVRNMK